MGLKNTVPPCVCVVGMHRSGTSALARMLQAAGWYFGPEAELIGATPDNPTGHYELRAIMDVNENILAAFGGSWHTPPALPADWLAHPRVRALGRDATRYLRRVVGRHARWAWKEPRTCLTLPFWLQLLGPMRLMVCVRHPLEVARSLKERNGMAVARGLQLWLHYNQQLMQAVQGHEVLVMSYERALAAPMEASRRLLAFVGGAAPVARSAGAMDPALRHQHSARDAGSVALPAEVARLYEALLQREDISGREAGD